MSSFSICELTGNAHFVFSSGLVAVSFWSMVAVVASGVVGRYLYVQIPKGIKGNELSVVDLEQENKKIAETLETRYRLDPLFLRTVDAMALPSRPANGMTSLEVLDFFFLQSMARRRKLRRAFSEVERSVDPGLIRPVRRLVRRRIAYLRRIAFLSQFRQMFHYWHVIHLPFAIIMFVIMLMIRAVLMMSVQAGLAVRREVWTALGGFPTPYFAYLEDLELAWRCWQRGLRVELVPAAVVVHHYEFSRSPLKMYLLERNRLLVLATCHEARTLALLAPPLLAFEAAIALVALLQGWGGQKARGWRWIVRHRRWVRERRREVQATRTVPDRALVRLVTDRFDPAQTPLPRAAAPLEWLLRVYWAGARRLV